MTRYVVQHNYSANGPDGIPIAFSAGAEVDLDEEVATWVNRDSAGTLAPVGAEPAVPEAAPTPPAVEVSSPPAADDESEVPAPPTEAAEATDEDDVLPPVEKSDDSGLSVGPDRDRSHRPGRRRY